ncbi:hypothetical protein Catovirus_1_112 [Catovirus CTV1]|uniref:Uncharacterized protein n=1 Tax=Catovirus CTV1 TaxID=1977631 RepID=A0A1V0S8N1_9VIRU|nr:hypothetical protein Catovirus_1_112 [Catovirus CTV1]
MIDINNVSLPDKVRLLKMELDKTDNEQYINEILMVHNKWEQLKKSNKVDNKIKDNVETLNKNDKKILVKGKKTVDKNNPKYIILLKLINSILTNLKMNNVDDLTEFKNVDRDDIIKEENINTYNKMEKDLFKYFDKKKCQWYRRTQIKNYILSFIRAACEDIGLNFTYVTKNKTKNNIVKSYVYYSII